MIVITRSDGVWICTIAVDETPAAYYSINGSADVAPIRGEGSDPHAALDDALRNLGLLTIENPPDAGRENAARVR